MDTPITPKKSILSTFNTPENMATGLGKVSTVSSLFVGLGDHLIGTAHSDSEYENLGLDGVLNGMLSLGNILTGSTAYAGSEAATEDWKNEQGITITSSQTDAGTIAYNFSCQDFTSEMKKLLLGAVEITAVPKPEWATADEASTLTALGWGHTSTPLIRPLAFLDETKTKILVMPKAKIIAALGMDGNKQIITIKATAEKLDTAKLKTVMSFELPKGVVYA